MSMALYDTLSEKPPLSGTIQLQGVEGPVPAKLCRAVQIELADRVYPWDVYVAPIRDDFLLGLDFLRAHRCQLDIAGQVLELGDSRLALHAIVEAATTTPVQVKRGNRLLACEGVQPADSEWCAGLQESKYPKLDDCTPGIAMGKNPKVVLRTSLKPTSPRQQAPATSGVSIGDGSIDIRRLVVLQSTSETAPQQQRSASTPAVFDSSPAPSRGRRTPGDRNRPSLTTLALRRCWRHYRWKPNPQAMQGSSPRPPSSLDRFVARKVPLALPGQLGRVVRRGLGRVPRGVG